MEMLLAGADRNERGRQLESEARVRGGRIETPTRDDRKPLFGIDAGQGGPAKDVGPALAARELLEQQLVASGVCLPRDASGRVAGHGGAQAREVGVGSIHGASPARV